MNRSKIVRVYESVIMRKIDIRDFDHPLYKAFQTLYACSFPIFEQRTTAQQKAAFACANYHLTACENDATLVGFISYWEFDTYLYVEHFAISTLIRGKGYGCEVLRDFIRSTRKIVLLEIDPVTDSVSAARLRFYRKCGFHENPYPHRHPAYRAGYAPHPLIVLTAQRPISAEEYQTFHRDLQTVVMRDH